MTIMPPMDPISAARSERLPHSQTVVTYPIQTACHRSKLQSSALGLVTHPKIGSLLTRASCENVSLYSFNTASLAAVNEDKTQSRSRTQGKDTPSFNASASHLLATSIKPYHRSPAGPCRKCQLRIVNRTQCTHDFIASFLTTLCKSPMLAIVRFPIKDSLSSLSCTGRLVKNQKNEQILPQRKAVTTTNI